MGYRIFIPTAGVGSRLGGLTKHLNKSLVSVGLTPALSRIIAMFPSDAEFVVALGYKGHLVREYLLLAHPNRVFYFVNVDPFEGPGSGLGLSILSCQEFLQQPFVFTSCDTLVQAPPPAPDKNWVGYGCKEDLSSYRTVKLAGGRVVSILEKGQGDNSCKPYIGLAGIADYQVFWDVTQKGADVAITQGEAFGLNGLLEKGLEIYGHDFTWFDTGNPVGLEEASLYYSPQDSPNILYKEDEAIWFIEDNVIKFSTSKSFIADRVCRGSSLKGFVPDVTGATDHMYRYKKAQGQVLSEVIDTSLFKKLLEHCTNFWHPMDLNLAEKKTFYQDCMNFYREKTLQRVAQFYESFGVEDGTEPINGILVPSLRKLLNQVDWCHLAEGLPCRFHGDFHFENIIWSASESKFTFLDWRQNFGGSLLHGDVYYDLAKLQHGLIINHGLINRGEFSVTWDSDGIRYDFLRYQKMILCQEIFESWVVQQGYDLQKVKILTALIYLNIATLHHKPYNFLLYALGKFLLHKELGGKCYGS